MKLHLYTPLYSLTLLLSAALLFAVQPMFSKMALPLLGGTPQVWNTAMLFFQVTLLGGYAYAHGTTRFLGIRAQAILHIFLLVLFTLVLPIAIPEGWLPPVNKDPALWQLSLMAITVGGPFFVLAGSAPMLQRWFTHTNHPDADNPYFLYGASNLGSMTALLAYPFLIEPMLTLKAQSNVWAAGYLILIPLVALSAFLIWTHKEKKPERKTHGDKPISWALRLQWIILAFIPSSLMLGVTTFITTDIASVPLLWILPLALYVGTFIIVFARKPPIPEKHIMFLQGFLMIALIAQMIMFRPLPPILIVLHMTLFFFSALACHTELAKLRPRASHLTEFYLLMSLGGALGGVFNALVAPRFFVIPVEYALALGAACFMRYASQRQTLPKKFNFEVAAAVLIVLILVVSFNINKEEHFALQGFLTLILVLCLSVVMDKRWLFAATMFVALAFNTPGHYWGKFYFMDIVHQERNFFGVIKVVDSKFGERVMLQGTTDHGTQALDEKHRLTPISYYSAHSPMSDGFSYLDRQSTPQKVAVIGLGAGATACFKKKGRSFNFFEIDPKVIRIAQNPEYFTFLRDCGSPYEIIPGDGRLTMKEQPDNHYDLILVDAFSSDNIPIHLLTVEAIEIYLRKLKKNGILLLHISNNFLDIEPVLTQAAKHLALKGYARISEGGKIKGTELNYYASHVFTMVKSRDFENFIKKRKWTPGIASEGVNMWTDQYSNILSVLINDHSASKARMKETAEKSGKTPDKE